MKVFILQSATAVDIECPLCLGQGSAIREDSRGRLFEWPCAYDCPPPIAYIVVNNRRR
jgi:hypothetical protein